MGTVYNLWYIRGYSDREDTKLHIGIYSTQDLARAAIRQLEDKPGFSDWPEGFEIHETPLDHTNWAEGFKSVIAPRQKEIPQEAFDLPYWPESK